LTDWRYDAIECDEAGLAGLLAQSGPEVVGYSCTMPLKRQLLRVADAVSEQAAAIGAGNTLLQVDGQWFADNTDWLGIRNALSEQGISASGSVTVLGAGGTAQAALAALAEADQVTVLVREPARTSELLEAADRLDISVTIGRLTETEVLQSSDLIISTLPAGAADPLAVGPWHERQALLDAAYQPWPSPVARAVADAGGTVVSGAAMLLHQAARQVELMTGQPAPVQAMRAALLAAAPGCGA
jgi:shikimate dehydrogenase